MSKYQPISCASYERLELSILHGEALLLSWQDAAGLDHLEVVRPRDLETCRGEEFLIACRESGSELRVRLDRIRQLRELVHKK